MWGTYWVFDPMSSGDMFPSVSVCEGVLTELHFLTKANVYGEDTGRLTLKERGDDVDVDEVCR